MKRAIALQHKRDDLHCELRHFAQRSVEFVLSFTCNRIKKRGGTNPVSDLKQRCAWLKFGVFTSVANYGQVPPLKRLAAARGVKLKAEKPDVTYEAARQQALGWAQVTLSRSGAVT